MKKCSICGCKAEPYIDLGNTVLCVSCAVKKEKEDKDAVIQNQSKPNDAK